MIIKTTSQFKIWIRAVALVTACLFFVNTISWAKPGRIGPSNPTTLQPALMFDVSDIAQTLGKNRTVQLEAEVALIHSLIANADAFPNYFDINAHLDFWYYLMGDHVKKSKDSEPHARDRLLDVKRIQKDGNNMVVEFKLFDKPGAGTFRMVPSPEKFKKGEAIKIERIDEKKVGTTTREPSKLRKIPGREYNFDDKGRLWKVIDKNTGITWEECSYMETDLETDLGNNMVETTIYNPWTRESERGKIKKQFRKKEHIIDSVTLYNPVTHRKIKCEFKGYSRVAHKRQIWEIKDGEKPLGWFEIGDGVYGPKSKWPGKTYTFLKAVVINEEEQNSGIGKKDTVSIQYNSYDCEDQDVLDDIDTLLERGVNLNHDC